MSQPTRSRTSSSTAEPELELAAHLRVLIARLARQLRQQAGTGLSPTQQSALVTIEASGPISLGDLAVAEQIAPPSVTRVVAKLEDDGLVQRQIDPGDRRVVRVSITYEGRRRLEHSRSRRNAWLARQVRSLDPADRDRLHAALPALEALTRRERDDK
jgi:DNA-binding MarR family transcriptional regulator